MATDFIFTKHSCLKQDLYNELINHMVTAGWQDISSNPATDYNVMYSNGESGNQDLVINMRPFYSGYGTSNSIHNSKYTYFEIRLTTNYTPGATGSAGTFSNPKQTWKYYLSLIPQSSFSLDLTSHVDYYVYADKDRMMCMVDCTQVNLGCLFFYLGLPYESYAGPIDYRDLTFLTSFSPVELTGNSGIVCSSRNADDVDNIFVKNQVTLALKNPNVGNTTVLSRYFLGSVKEGVRMKFEGFYQFTHNESYYITGDTLHVGNDEYKIFILDDYYNYGSFPYVSGQTTKRAMAIKVAK